MIKVCGMRDRDNIHAVAETGIDLMGFIFWQKSPRCAGKERIEVPSNVAGVGVFVDEEPGIIADCVVRNGLSYIQLHGNESPSTIRQLKALLPHDIKVIKALSIREADDVKRWRLYADTADMFLFDTKCECVGGSGEHFDWTVLSHYDGDIPFLLSGGIGPDDADRVNNFQHPQCAGIDLNSRFEIQPGHKDATLIANFIKKIKQ